MRLRTKNFLLCLLSIIFLAALSGAFRIFAFAEESAADVGGGTNPNRAAANVYSDGDNAGELNGVYFSLPKGTSIPYSADWTVAYAPENAAALKLLRGNTSYEMGTGNGTIIKYGTMDCYLKVEAWMLKDYSSYLPLKDGDVIVADGVFANSDNGSRFNISRTLFEITGDKADGFSVNVITESEDTVRLGTGFDINKNPEVNDDGVAGIYFGLKENDSVTSGTVYTPTDKSVVTFRRKGVNRTYNSVTLVKKGAAEYLLDCSGFGIALPLRPGDLLTIDGIFKSEDSVSSIRVDKTYVSLEEESGVTVAKVTSYDPSVIQAGKAVSDARKPNVNSSDGTIWGMYFDLPDGTNIPFDTGWNLGYAPEKASNIRMYRDGEYFPIGKSGMSTLIKFSATEVYFKTEAWMLSNADKALPLRSGDLIVLEGRFTANNTTFSMSETTIKIAKSDDGEFITDVIGDFREELINRMSEDYPLGNYDRNEKKQIGEIVASASEKIRNSQKAVNAYEVYVDTVNKLKNITVSPDAIDNLNEKIKPAAIGKLKNFVDRNDYFEAQQQKLDQIIAEYSEKILGAGNQKEVSQFLSEARTDIDSLLTKANIIEKAITSQTDGWEEYLETYNVVSLRDINFGESLHLKKEGGNTEAINTDERFNNVFNSFVPTSGNDTSSVVFKFYYENNGQQPYVQFFVRGQMWFGYLFTIGTGGGSTGGYWAQRLDEDTTKDSLFTANSGHSLTNGVRYEVELGAVDLKETDRTWIYVKVDGKLGLSTFYDTLAMSEGSFRISVKAALNNESDYTISNCEEKLTPLNTKKVGAFTLADGHTDGANGLYATLVENDVLYAKDKSLSAYAVTENAVVLRRNGEIIKNISTRVPAIQKYTQTNYYIPIATNGFTPQQGDELTIDGDFAYFSSDSNEKFIYSVSRSVFVFNNGAWEQKLSLDDAKNGAKNELDGYADISLYDEKEASVITELIKNAKTAIDSATTTESVVNILRTAESKIDEVKTTLGKYADEAIKTIEAYKKDNLSDYSPEAVAEINRYKAEAKAEILSADSKARIDSLKQSYLERIDTLKTSAETSAEELSAQKDEGKQSVKDIYGGIDLSKLTEDEIADLNKETQDVLRNIDGSATKEQVSSLVDAYESKYNKGNQQSGKTEKKGCKSSVIIPVSACLAFAIAATLVMIIYKKNKKRS